MKKALLTAIILIAATLQLQSQAFKVGLKAGPNFSNFTGGVSGINYQSRTGFHAGAAAEIGLSGKLSIAPEILYSSQGAEVDGPGDFNLDYVAVPILARIYILSDKLSVDVGPQFSFVVQDWKFVSSANQALENESFDFAMAGGATLHITKSIFAQARYTLGLTEASKDAEVRNSVFQLSLGYNFM